MILGSVLKINQNVVVAILLLKISLRGFLGGPLAKTPCSQCKGLGFDPWSGN